MNVAVKDIQDEGHFQRVPCANKVNQEPQFLFCFFSALAVATAR